MDQYIHSPIHLHGIVLNQLSRGTTLPYLTLPYHPFKRSYLLHIFHQDHINVHKYCVIKVLRKIHGSMYQFLKWLEVLSSNVGFIGSETTATNI
jgi:hypothetical protein